jgi:hypothetical protein
MPDSNTAMPWMTAWIELQRQWVEAAARVPGASGDALRALFADRYQQVFTPEFARLAPVPDPLLADAAVVARWQGAMQRFGLQIAAIASDASRRLSAELLSDDAALPPVTSLRQLHRLWIECGEAAYAAAAHGDEYAKAQAELLGAWVELQAAPRCARP